MSLGVAFYLLFLSTLFVMRIGAEPVAAATPLASVVGHVVIISIDGLRPDALLQAVTPSMDLYLEQGASARLAMTVVPSITLPAHASMLSGLTIQKHGITWNGLRPNLGPIQVPTVFTESKRHGLTTAMFVRKEKLVHLAAPGSVDVFRSLGEDDLGVATAAAQYLVTDKPHVLFVHLPQTDRSGHTFEWMSLQQLQAVSIADQAVGLLANAVQDAGIASRTLVIITSDHGGHGIGHGTDDPRDTTIPWLVAGPQVKSGYIIQQPLETMDTAATALKALGIPIPPDSDGRPVLEAFEPGTFDAPTPIPSTNQWGLMVLALGLSVTIFIAGGRAETAKR